MSIARDFTKIYIIDLHQHISCTCQTHAHKSLRAKTNRATIGHATHSHTYTNMNPNGLMSSFGRRQRGMVEVHLIKIPTIHSPDLPSSLVIVNTTWQQGFHRNGKRIGIIPTTTKSSILSTRRRSTLKMPTETTQALFRKVIIPIAGYHPSKPSGTRGLLVMR